MNGARLGLVGFGLAWVLASCEAAEQPPYLEVVTLSGDPYHRGLEHGRRLSSKIRSFYAQLVSNSLEPSLNRDRTDIAATLLRYQAARYDDGKFGHLLLLESAQSLAESIPEPYLQEMRGIADGSGLPYDDVLVLNTFLDSMMSVRTVQDYLRRVHSPRMLWFEVDGGLGDDAFDNDGDGEIDEPEEGRVDPYEPSAHALLVEVPAHAVLRFGLEDPEGVDPESIRVTIEDRLYVFGDPAMTTTVSGENSEQLEVQIVPAGGLPTGAVVAMQLLAGDRSWATSTPPAHAWFMRDEFVALGTSGLGLPPHGIQNRALKQDRFPSPAIAFTARGAATVDGALLAAHHFALLDLGTCYKHSVVLVHQPDDGAPFVTVGWAGLVWGTSGMNADGLAWMANTSESLDNPLLQEFQTSLIAASLVAKGVPMGIMGREVLSRSADAAEGVALLRELQSTLGWNFLLADQGREAVVMEMDANTPGDADGGKISYGPGATDERGSYLASMTGDDLRMASHFQANRDDIEQEIFGYRVRAQRYWSSFWHRSLRGFYILGDAIVDRYGVLDVDGMGEILRLPDLVDRRDSMNAVIFEPALRRLHVAAGQMPATDGDFETVILNVTAAGAVQ